MSSITQDAPGKSVLYMGNEAIARGVIEAGVNVCAGYPGNPSSEILTQLAKLADKVGFYLEWSINEKVAAEVAAAASLAGLRGFCTMKQNGLNVASDFLLNLNLTGSGRGSLVVLVADDPGGISSSNEEDTRIFAKQGDLPLLEPSNAHEAKEMIKTAFDLSEQLSLPVLFRSVTRVSHARGNVRLGELPEVDPKPSFGKSERFSVIPTIPKYHILLHEKLDKAKKVSGESPYNFYRGPEKPELVVITCGSGWPHSLEAIRNLEVEEKVGVLKLGMTWPLPEELIIRHLNQADRFLFIEEIDPVMEENIKALYGQKCAERKLGTKTFFGKATGHIPDVGELNPEIVIDALQKLTGANYEARPADYARRIHEATANYIPNRAQGYCPGCPHRATFWGVKTALALDGRDGFVLGDIGCYSMAVGPSGFHQIRTIHAMGSGAGLASGFGELDKFGFDQPVLAVCGDGTFFHAASAALANGFYNDSNFILILLDNSATAMTGFQTHPGIGKTATGKKVGKIELEKLCEALGAHVEVADPLNLKGFVDTLLGLLENEKRGPKVLISRRECALVRVRSMGQKKLFNMKIMADRCVGEECGCNRLCTRVFKCPALLWDKNTGKARIDEALCNGCGVCAEICPASAIVKEEV